MSDILLELDEAERQEKIERFWKENGNTLIVCIVVTIIATGLISAWRSWEHSVKTAGTDKILALMEDKTFPDNITDKSAEGLRPSLRGILFLNAAQASLDKKKQDQALALYAKVADDKAIPADIRDLGILMTAELTPDAATNDQIVKNINDVAGHKNSPWQYHALVEAAVLAASKNDYKTAREHLAKVMDQKSLPETLYNKARALDHVYVLKMPKDEKPAEKTGT